MLPSLAFFPESKVIRYFDVLMQEFPKSAIEIVESELHAGRAEFYYRPAGFAGRILLLRAVGPQQARSRPTQYLLVLLNDCQVSQ